MLEADGHQPRCSASSAPASASGAVAATAAAKARSRSGSLTPGRTSVPLAVSTANGDVAAIASATFSGVQAAATG